MTLSAAQGLPILPRYINADTGNREPIQYPSLPWHDVKIYGALGNSSNDDTAAFQAALNAISSIGGGALYIPFGTYKITSTLTYSGIGLLIIGSGTGSILTPTQLASDVFQFSGLGKVTLRDFLVDMSGVVPTGGTMFNFTNTSGSSGNIIIDGLFCNGGWNIFSFLGGGQVFIDNCIVNNYLATGINFGPLFGGGAFLSNIQSAVGPTTSGNGLIIAGGDTFDVANCNFASQQQPILIQPASGGFVRNAFFTNVFADGVGRSSGNQGWLFNGTAGGGAVIQRMRLNNCWAGTNQSHGFEFQNALDVIMTGCIAITNVGHGIYITGSPSADQLRIIGCTMEGNSFAASGTYSGIHLDNFINDVTIIGCRLGPSSIATNTQKYGVEITGPNGTNILVADNDVSGNATGGISNGATGNNNIIRGNIGYNPVGTSAGANVGTSPATITAGPTPETHYLNQSATNTATITKGTRQIATLANSSTYYVVELGPNESYVVTWLTTQPTFVRDIH